MAQYYRVTTQVNQHERGCVSTTSVNVVMTEMRKLASVMPVGTIVRVYLPNGELLRQWFAGDDHSKAW
jgi:hypothetical protein